MSLGLDCRKEFLENGFLHLRSFIDPVDCQRLILRMRELTERRCQSDQTRVFEAGEDRHTADDFFLSSANKIAFFFDKNATSSESHQKKFNALNKVGHALHNLCPVYQKFSHQKKFYSLVSLLGQQKPLLVQSMFIFKQSRFGDEVPAHQDASFLYTEPDSVIGLWFALEDADEENGCLWVLSGGHKDKLKNRFLKDERGLSFQFNQRVDWPRRQFKPLVAKAGDAIALHGFLPHFSEKNRSPKTRFAYTIHFIDQKSYYPKTNWLDTAFN